MSCCGSWNCCNRSPIKILNKQEGDYEIKIRCNWIDYGAWYENNLFETYLMNGDRRFHISTTSKYHFLFNAACFSSCIFNVGKAAVTRV